MPSAFQHSVPAPRPQHPAGWSMGCSAIGSRRSHLWAIKDSNEVLWWQWWFRERWRNHWEGSLLPLRWACEQEPGPPRGSVQGAEAGPRFRGKNTKEHFIHSQTNSLNHVLWCLLIQWSYFQGKTKRRVSYQLSNKAQLFDINADTLKTDL